LGSISRDGIGGLEMTNTGKWILGGSLVVIAGAVLVILGILIGMLLWGPVAGLMNNTSFMMPAIGSNVENPMWSGMGYGMMGNNGMMGGGYFTRTGAEINGGEINFTPETVHEQLEAYLEEAGEDDLEVGEIMIFDNHAYAQIIESATGVGAKEVLVDPGTLAIAPEPGPNMMWNQKYSSMHGGGMMGTINNGGEGEAMQISSEEAVQIAQEYLDRSSTALDADGHADPFYGYYTIHTLRDGEVIGMLSVHGYSGQVFPHTWHGELITMSGGEDH
jgi:hypothetical protein